MRYIILCFLLMISFFINQDGWAQSTPSSTAVQLAAKMADCMRDSLGLSDAQRQQVYNVNISLHNSKSQAWTQYANNRARLQNELQNIESTRDSLYNIILGPAGKYQLYISKKANIIKSN